MMSLSKLCVSRSAGILFVLLLSGVLLGGCVSAYDTGGEEFVEGEETCEPTGDEICDGIDNNCVDGIDEGCDDDGDSYCDANRQVEGTPEVCPMGGGDCDDEEASVNPGAMEICDNLDNNCAGGPDEGCDDDEDDFCDADMETVQDGAGNFPDVCPLGRDDCDDEDPMLTSPVWYLDDDGDGYGLTNTLEETCTPPQGYAPLPDDCDDSDENVNPAATEICDDIDNNCVDGVDEMCDTDEDGYCDISQTVSDPPPSTCPNGGGDCDDTRAEAYPGAEELCNDVLDNCDAMAADEGCNDDGDDYCDDTFTTPMVDGSFPMVCTAGGGDCDDEAMGINPGAMERCGLTDNDCSGMPPAIDDMATFSVLRPPPPESRHENLASDGSELAITYGEYTEDGWKPRLVITDSNGTIEHAPVDLAPAGSLGEYVDAAWIPDANVYAAAYTGPDSTNGGWSVYLTLVDDSGAITHQERLAEARVDARVAVLGSGSTAAILFDGGPSTGASDLNSIMYDASSQTPSAVRTVESGQSVSSVDFAVDDTYLVVIDYISGPEFSMRRNRLTDNSPGGPYNFTVPDISSDYSFHTIGGNFYVVWTGPNNGNTSYCCDRYLYAQQVRPQSFSTTVGGRLTIAESYRYGRRIIGENPSSGEVYLIHEHNDGAGDTMRVNRLSPTLAIDGGSNISNITPAPSSDFRSVPNAWVANRVWFADNRATNDYFTLYGVSAFGNTSEETPVSGGVVTSDFEAFPRYAGYDAAADEYVWVQSDGGTIELTRIAADGTPSTFVESAGDSGGTWFYSTSGLLHWTNDYTQMAQDCVFNFHLEIIDESSGMRTPGDTYSVPIMTQCFDVYAYPATEPIEAGGRVWMAWQIEDNFNFNFQTHVTSNTPGMMGGTGEQLSSEPFAPVSLTALPDGRAAIIYRDSNNLQLKFGGTDGSITTTPLEILPATSGISVGSIQAGAVGTKLFIFAYVRDTNTNEEYLRQWVVDLGTDMVTSTTDLRTLPEDRQLTLRVIETTDSHVAVLSWDQLAPTTTAEVYIVDEMEMSNTIALMDTDDLYDYRLTGQDDYFVLAAPGYEAQRFVAMGADGTVVSDVDVPVQSIEDIDPLVWEISDSGQLRFLARSSQRSLVSSLTCQ